MESRSRAIIMSWTFSTQFPLEWREMILSNNHEYKFGIISFSSSSYSSQSDSHLLLHQAWIIKTTTKVFRLLEIYICNCLCGICWNVKGKFNISVRYLNSNRELSNWPLSATMCHLIPLVSAIFCCQENVTHHQKLFIPAENVVNMFSFSGFHPRKVVHFHYINLFRESGQFFLCLPFGFWSSTEEEWDEDDIFTLQDFFIFCQLEVEDICSSFVREEIEILFFSPLINTFVSFWLANVVLISLIDCKGIFSCWGLNQRRFLIRTLSTICSKQAE